MQISADGTPEGDSPSIRTAETDAGGAWRNNDGTILFSAGLDDGLFKVPVAGRKSQEVLKLDSFAELLSCRCQQLLPDGKNFLFFGLADALETTGRRL